MKNSNFQIVKCFSVIWSVSSFLFATGIIASLFAAYLGYLTNIYFGSIITLLFAIFTGKLGWWATKLYLENCNKKNPSKVLVDEFSGQLIATSITSSSPFVNILALLLFRFFIL